MISSQLLWVQKNELPQAWQSHAMESGGIKLTAKPASVLAKSLN